MTLVPPCKHRRRVGVGVSIVVGVDVIMMYSTSDEKE
jgi:hypothetical protein